jgi:Tol biopolymer transport system component
MNADGSGLRRLTTALGYDGGAFFSPDGKQIVFRAYRPRTPEEIADYRALLRENLIRPSKLEILVMNADGTGERQVTRNGAANFCPYFTPDGRRIIFASNMEDPAGRNFDLYLIGVDGSNLQRVTTDPSFDGFPMFSPDGKRLVWASNRNAKQMGDTNVFIARWAE